ncbi:helix-turn-helix domain-containing protein [Paraburkholderia sp. Ac-20340]|uniref:helix-turn-helix domain-containing protein n=1 Tax=Paraburkholderia sp. Ac-20340 TaxID=2703888 RepID=UPI001F121E5D|nr:helix-turn-helix domain-containing protein [Paraburkholderia sp. Ac-20340]
MKPWTWRHAIIKSGLSPTTRHVLLTLSCHLNDLGEDCFPSTAMLAEETGLSERSVCTHLTTAASLGWFVVRKHGFAKQRWARHEYLPRIPEGFEIRAENEGTETGSVPSKRGRGAKALKDVQCPVDKGTEAGSVPSEKALNVVQEGTEPSDVKALNEVQSNTAVNPTKKSSSNASAENPAAAAAQNLGSEENSSDIAEPDREAELLNVLEQAFAVAVDPKADRVLVLTWVGKGVTAEQLREAVRRAAKRREQASDNRPVYAAFLDRFVTEVLSGAARADEPAPSVEWWLSDSGIGEQGKRVRVERRANESTPDFLVRVAKASGRGPWIDYVLMRERGAARFPEVVDFLSDVLPADF